MVSDGRWVCLDVGETLIDETRIWSIWADVLGIPRLTLMAAIGALIARDTEHGGVFSEFGLSDAEWRARAPEVEERYGGFRTEDLYPDALRAIRRLVADGYRLAVVANQPAVRSVQLRRIGVGAEVIAMSEELGASKPDPAFFARMLELMGSPDPNAVAYVGDRVDNDVVAGLAAGLRAIWLRRGPWGIIQRLPEGTRPALVVGSLDELTDRIGEAF